MFQKDIGGIDCLVNNAYPKNKNYGKQIEDVVMKTFLKIYHSCWWLFFNVPTVWNFL